MSDTLEQPRRIGRYVLGEVLGRGAMGVVYKAEDPLIARTVAVKLLHVTKDLEPGQMATLRERFLREAQTAGNLDHPNIVRVLDAGCDDETQELYLVMEYLPGPSLETLTRDGALAREKICELVRQVGAALDAAHARGVIHRDVKPANILYADETTAKIADFGIARVGTSQLTQDMRDLGTPIYMSPEQVAGRPLDGRADLFSLGVLAYHLLTGVPPFTGKNTVSVAYQIVHSTPPLPSSVCPDLPPGLDRVIARILAKDPDDRYGSGREFHEDFSRVLMGLPADTRTAKAPKPWRGAFDPRLLSLIGIGLLTAGVAAITDGSKQTTAPILEPARAAAREPRSPQAPPSAGAGAVTTPTTPGSSATSRGASVPSAPAPRPRKAVPPPREPPPAPRELPLVLPPAPVPHEGLGANATEAAPASIPQVPAARETGLLNVHLGHRIRGGTLQVWMDGRPILSDAFEKRNRLLPYQTTKWIGIPVPTGRHEITARIEAAKGQVSLSEPLTVNVEPSATLEVRMVIKDDAIVFKSGS